VLGIYIEVYELPCPENLVAVIGNLIVFRTQMVPNLRVLVKMSRSPILI